MQKLEFVQVIAGLILTFGAAGMVTDMPPDASWTTWLVCASIALIGLICMFMGVLMMQTRRATEDMKRWF